MEEVIGMVKNGIFVSNDTEQNPILTRIRIHDSIEPAASRIDLTEYEGKAILVNCSHNDGTILWESKVVDVGSPLVNAMVKKILKVES